MKASAKKVPVHFRQGDVLIVMVDQLPATVKARKRTSRGIVLAEGEVTGHAHAITARKVTHYDAPNAAEAARQLLKDVGLTIEIETDERVSFLDLGQAAELRHEEHGTIALPAGRAVVIRQREYSPAAIRVVGD